MLGICGSPRLGSRWSSSIALVGLAAIMWCGPAAAGCLPVSFGLDTLGWDRTKETFLGVGLGQSFLATEELLTRITVWRPPGDVDAVGSRMFVTTADSLTGLPDATQVLGTAYLFVRDSDPPGTAIEMPFDFAPPITLLKRGAYAFFLQREECDGGLTDLMAKSTDPYPDGLYWQTARVSTGTCRLRPVDGGENYTDLMFRIDYCATSPTSIKRSTWGELKLRYR